MLSNKADYKLLAKSLAPRYNRGGTIAFVGIRAKTLYAVSNNLGKHYHNTQLPKVNYVLQVSPNDQEMLDARKWLQQSSKQ